MSNPEQTGTPAPSQDNPNQSTAANSNPIIVVTGDPICERNLVQLKTAPQDGTPSARVHTLYGGSVYLTKLIKKSCPEDCFNVIGPEFTSDVNKPSLESDVRVGQAFAIWNALPLGPSGNKSDDQVWRMAQDYLGYDAIDAKKLKDEVAKLKEELAKPQEELAIRQQSCESEWKSLYPVLGSPDSAHAPDLLVIYDRGLGFCQVPDLWPRCLWPVKDDQEDQKNQDVEEGQRDFQIVLKTSLRVIQQQQKRALSGNAWLRSISTGSRWYYRPHRCGQARSRCRKGFPGSRPSKI